jgi:hypothetical protein
MRRMQEAKHPNVSAILRNIEVPLCEDVIVFTVVVISQMYYNSPV